MVGPWLVFRSSYLYYRLLFNSLAFLDFWSICTINNAAVCIVAALSRVLIEDIHFVRTWSMYMYIW